MSRLCGQIGERRFLGLRRSASSMPCSDCRIAASLRLLLARSSLRRSQFSLSLSFSLGRVSAMLYRRRMVGWEGERGVLEAKFHSRSRVRLDLTESS